LTDSSPVSFIQFIVNDIVGVGWTERRLQCLRFSAFFPFFFLEISSVCGSSVVAQQLAFLARPELPKGTPSLRV
jgi:hypothetical protein